MNLKILRPEARLDFGNFTEVSRLDDHVRIEKKILELVDPFVTPPSKIDWDATIVELGVLDSHGILELVAWYEEFFCIKLNDEEINIENLGSINKMAAFAVLKREGR